MTTAKSPRLDGCLLTAGDPGYDAARTVWNAMIDRRPRMIVRAASVSDVVIAVRLARELDLEIGVRCGGHNVAGFAVPANGLMVDLTLLNRVRVDPVRRRARVQGGALLGALDQATQPYGLATTAGNVSHTGVGGLTLGGGMGWLARQHGLACDNVVSYTIVTADGQVVTASRTEHPDLYWGLRGGGGNFGIVTEFEFRLHHTGTQTLVAEFDFRAEDAVAVLEGWRDLNAVAPRQATFTAEVSSTTSGPVATIGFVWVGDPAAGHRLLPAMRALGRPIAERVTMPSYLALQQRDDTVAGPAYRRYSRAHYLQQFPSTAIEAFLLRGASDLHAGTLLPGVGLQAHGGAIADVADTDAAFSHRSTLFEFGADARWTDPSEDDNRMVAARAAAATLDPYAGGVYVNSLAADEGRRGVRRAYPAAKLARLTTVKTRWDPQNVFHLNHNIRPGQA
ncbi:MULTISPECIES: FAD-binding oxidoreductase [Micromonospora]|uniref:FAD-linked oxidase n=1 Tax=Micromonospora maris TaxID=1003110 RepID=A0A9X0LCP4_9ACTN|nr:MULTISPECIES: FAD-binding oxidoreductase [Micromonospora]AEB46028.1 FAD linked oxidase domain-containing protein [Micromonospora maris AB-18-032]KUJ45324.1 FAD-linked oxidase [Micromonospora maris]RUL94620.1 FAD-binding oxidoreductase [Verrucosispora sp. FIM060022]